MNQAQGGVPDISVILPFYKQDDHVSEVVSEFAQKLDAFGKSYEIIVVINGVASLEEEQTYRVISESPFIAEHRLKQAGWGRAVRWGIAHARGTYVCYTNSARTTGDEVVRLFAYALVASDAVVKATRIERSTRMRKWVSICYNLENKFVLKTPIWDVNATPKIIPKYLLDTIPLFSFGDSIDAELMYKLFKIDVPIIEIPIRQTQRKVGSSTTNWMSALRMFVGILDIRFNSTRNHE